MDKKDLKKIYKKLTELRKESRKTEGILKSFLNAIDPGTRHFIIYERGVFTSACEILEIAYGKHFAEDVSYWFYECCESKIVLTCIDSDGKKYEMNTLNNYLNFLEATADYIKQND